MPNAEPGFCTIPTAAGPPHAGHVLNMMVNRHLFNIVNDEYTSKWLVVFDSPDAMMDPYLELHDKLKWKVDEVIHIVPGKFSVPPSYVLFHEGGIPQSGALRSHFNRLCFFREHGVSTIARGWDLKLHAMMEYELMNNFWQHIGIPKTLYHPVLVGRDGKKLSCSDGNAKAVTRRTLTKVMDKVRKLYDPRCIMEPYIKKRAMEPIKWNFTV